MPPYLTMNSKGCNSGRTKRPVRNLSHLFRPGLKTPVSRVKLLDHING